MEHLYQITELKLGIESAFHVQRLAALKAFLRYLTSLQHSELQEVAELADDEATDAADIVIGVLSSHTDQEISPLQNIEKEIILLVIQAMTPFLPDSALERQSERNIVGKLVSMLEEENELDTQVIQTLSSLIQTNKFLETVHVPPHRP